MAMVMVEAGVSEAVVIVVVVGRGGGGGFGHCLKIRKEEFGDLAQDMELGEDGGRHSGWGRWWWCDRSLDGGCDGFIR